MIIAIPLLGIGWLAYYLWDRKMTKEEQNRPKPVSKQLQKTRNEMADWAKQMAEFKPPKRKPSYEDDEDEETDKDS